MEKEVTYNPHSIATSSAIRAIADERLRAHAKHSLTGRSCEQMSHDDPIWLAVLTEEVGEVARAMCDHSGWSHMWKELIQVAAMATAWADAIERDGMVYNEGP